MKFDIDWEVYEGARQIVGKGQMMGWTFTLATGPMSAADIAKVEHVDVSEDDQKYVDDGVDVWTARLDAEHEETGSTVSLIAPAWSKTKGFSGNPWSATRPSVLALSRISNRLSDVRSVFSMVFNAFCRAKLEEKL